MPLFYVTGDAFLTKCQTLALGYNARGQSESRDELIAMLQEYPAVFATFQRQARKGKITAGELWTWTESLPQLQVWVLRESAYGASRIRYVQSIAMTFARDYQLHGITSLALIRPGTDIEYPEFKPLLEEWLDPLAIPIYLYENYSAGVQADESAIG